jgi:hypothetical protein
VAANTTMIGEDLDNDVSAVHRMRSTHWFPLFTWSGKAERGEQCVGNWAACRGDLQGPLAFHPLLRVMVHVNKQSLHHSRSRLGQS